MRDFAATELHHRFHAIPFFQKSNRVIFLEFVIMIVGVGTEFQFLHLNDVLLAFGLVLLLLVFVLPLAVVHGLGDRRFGGGRDQDQVQAHVLRLAHRSLGGHYFHRAVG